MSADNVESGSIELTPERDLRASSEAGDACTPRFMILTVAEGAHDHATTGVFSEISRLLAQACRHTIATVTVRTIG